MCGGGGGGVCLTKCLCAMFGGQQARDAAHECGGGPWHTAVYTCGASCAAPPPVVSGADGVVSGRGLHTTTFRLNSSAFCGIGVHSEVF